MAGQCRSRPGAPVKPLSRGRNWGLPFVTATSFWSVTPSGDYGRDCAAGEKFAEQALQASATARFPHLLAWIMADMIRVQAPGGLEIGFLAVIARRSALAGQLQGVAA